MSDRRSSNIKPARSGPAGVFGVDAAGYAEERVISLAIQPDGKIVAGAHTSAGKLTLLRLWGEQAGRVYYLHDGNGNRIGGQGWRTSRGRCWSGTGTAPTAA